MVFPKTRILASHTRPHLIRTNQLVLLQQVLVDSEEFKSLITIRNSYKLQNLMPKIVTCDIYLP